MRQGSGLFAICVFPIERNKKAGVRIYHHRDSSLSLCRCSPIDKERPFKIFLDRDEKSGMSTFSCMSGFNGQIRATGVLRFSTMTSSPCSIQARISGKVLRTWRIVAVFIMWTLCITLKVMSTQRHAVGVTTLETRVSCTEMFAGTDERPAVGLTT